MFQESLITEDVSTVNQVLIYVPNVNGSHSRGIIILTESVPLNCLE